MPPAPTGVVPPHAQAPSNVVADLRSDPESGLSHDEAATRLAADGLNELPLPPRASVLRILLDQLRSIIVLLLVVAVLVSAFSGEYLQAVAIAAALVINAALGTVTEVRARRAIEALLGLDVPRAVALRQGDLRVIEARHLVAGDIIQLEAGRQVPADARLVTTAELRVDEAPLTGESVPVSKDPTPTVVPETPLAERVTMVYKGTTVVAGHGRGVVTGTGVRTEVGRIGVLMQGVHLEPTPLERKLDLLGRRLVWVTLAIAGVIAALGIWQGQPMTLVIETAIALAVAAVPEALPAVATIALAVGMRRMARRHALVRRLPAVEALGATTVICTDKTRTLTSGQMTVVRLRGADESVPLGGEGAVTLSPLMTELLGVAARASQSQPDERGHLGDPVDAAIVAAAQTSAGAAVAPGAADAVAGIVPFSSVRKRMVVFYRDGGGYVACVKGAPRAILAATDRVRTGTGDAPLTDAAREALVDVNNELAREGLRVLGVASGAVASATDEAVHGLVFLGFIGLADPPAAGVQETVTTLRAAGLRTVMLTGDQALTAEAVGRAVGVLVVGESAVDGHTLDNRSGDEVRELVRRHAAFARVTPEHKLVVIRALQASGDVVAMIGDGINDAAALRQADVGVAMGGRGTDVAKQAASIVLQDDRFETIAAAVEEGRVIFDNIRKFVFYLFSCNVAEILVLLGAGLVGWPLPLQPLQLLWLNLVTDTFPALALALEPGDPRIMVRPPRRPDAAILSRPFLLEVSAYAGLITAATLGAFAWGLAYAPVQASTMAFLTLGLAQILHLGTARSETPLLTVARAVSNPYAIAGVVVAVLLQGVAMFVPPVARVLNVVPLGVPAWGVVLAAAIVPAVFGQAHKVWRHRSG